MAAPPRKPGPEPPRQPPAGQGGGRDDAGPPRPDDADDWESAAREWDAEVTVGDQGPLPLEENPFAETPITVAGGGQEPLPPAPPPLSLADVGFDDGGEAPLTIEVDAPDEDAPAAEAWRDHSLFSSEPPPDPPVASLSEPLPEMAADIWQAGVRALVSVPDSVTPVWPESAYWSDLGRLYLDELGVADTAARQVELTLAAAEVAELAADPAAALALYDDALTLAPDAPEALRARARLCEAVGDAAAAQAAWARLAEVAPTVDERTFYAALDAEWTLARRGELDAAGLDAFPDGPARSLAAAEAALLQGTPGEVAAALEEAAFSAGGALGGALLDAAARFYEVGGDTVTAAERRFVAAQMDPASGAVPLGRLRDAARLDPGQGEEVLAEILKVLPPSSLAGAVGRWAASLARRRGDSARAQTLLADGARAAAGGAPGDGGVSRAVVRAEIDLALEGGRPIEEATLARAQAAVSGSPGAATLALDAAVGLARAGDAAGALARLAGGLELAPDAAPLAILAEEIARGSADPAVQIAGFDLWLRADPARRPEAALALAHALESRGSNGAAGDLAVRAALQTAIEAAPGGAAFWTIAVRDGRAGRVADAAATMAYGAEIWGASPLGRFLAERAAEHAARTAPAEARARLEALAAADPNPALRWTLARVAARAGDEAGQAAALAAGAALEADPHGRAWAAIRRALVMRTGTLGGSPRPPAMGSGEASSPSPDATGPRPPATASGEPGAAPPDASPGAPGAASAAGAAGGGAEFHAGLEAALGTAPDHPVALALLFGDAGAPPERVTTALWDAGARTGARQLRLVAVAWAALSGQHARALALARQLHEADTTFRPARAALVRAAGHPDEREAGQRVLAALTAAPGDEADGLMLGDVLEASGDTERATAVLRMLCASAPSSERGGATGGRFAAEARRALARMGALPHDEALPLGGFARPADREAEEASAALARLVDAARAGRWSDAEAAIEASPPHLDSASPGALYAAGLLAEGRGDPARAPLLFVASAITGAPETRPLAGVVRASDSDVGAEARLSALEMAATRFGSQGPVSTPTPASSDEKQKEKEAAAGEPASQDAAALAQRPAEMAADGRSAATFLLRAAAERATASDKDGAARALLRAVLADPGHLPAAIAARRSAARRGDVAATIDACEHEAGVLVVPEARIEILLLGAALAGKGPGEARARALELLRRTLEIDPTNDVAFERLRALLGEAGDHQGLADALAARIAVARNPFELTALHLARAELLAGPLGDRAAAKAELHTILHKETQHARALARLGDLEYEDHNYAEAGELYVRRTVVERSTAELREVFLRIGRIYTRHHPDAQRAASAYERVLQIEPDNYEALAVLSDLHFAAGEVKSALAVTEKLTTLETDPARRLAALVRAGQLWERTGDLRQAGARLRRAADEAPRDGTAVTELARFLERTRDLAGRRALLDHSVGLLRHDVERGQFDLGSLKTLVPLLQARGKVRAAAAAAQLVAALAPELGPREDVPSWAAPPPRGRRLSALATPEIDERSFPPALPPGVRHVFRLVGPLLVRGAPDLERAGVGRADRVGRGHSPRDVVDAVTTELGTSDVDVYVKPAGKAASGAVLVEPGAPPAVIIGAPVLGLGSGAVRFAAARAVRLVTTHLDVVLGASPSDAGALIGGVVRQFVPDYKHPEVREEMIEIEAERLGKLLSRKVKQEVLPFAIESAGAFDLGALHAAVRDGANAAGLLYAGDLPAALAVVLAGHAAAPVPTTLQAIATDAEALALLRFALSDDYDAMAQAME